MDSSKKFELLKSLSLYSLLTDIETVKMDLKKLQMWQTNPPDVVKYSEIVEKRKQTADCKEWLDAYQQAIDYALNLEKNATIQPELNLEDQQIDQSVFIEITDLHDQLKEIFRLMKNIVDFAKDDKPSTHASQYNDLVKRRDIVLDRLYDMGFYSEIYKDDSVISYQCDECGGINQCKSWCGIYDPPEEPEYDDYKDYNLVEKCACCGCEVEGYTGWGRDICSRMCFQIAVMGYEP